MTNKYDVIRPLMDTDAYKIGHRGFYPKGTEFVYSNYTNRGSRVKKITDVVNFGLQAFLRSWAMEAWEKFFAAEEDEVAALYEDFVTSVIGPNTVGSEHIRALHKLGYLPLEFRALPEGVLVPLRVPTFTVENTHPEFAWLTNYIETALSASVWQPQTSATLAHRFHSLLLDFAEQTGGDKEFVTWQGHDFSFRGMAGIEAAAASGAAHLLSFSGSDNLNVVNFVNDNYPGENGLILGSVPATEHSVATSYGPDGDVEYFLTALESNPTGIVSVVADSYDLWATITETLPAIKEKILARDGKLVIRPDSGDPVEILTGTLLQSELDGTSGVTAMPPFTPEEKGLVELLWDEFGGTINEKGYKVLDSHIGAIYGDSITFDRAEQILQRLKDKGFASTNVVFGVGSYTYQYVTRDTFGSAIKATWVQIDGEGKAIWKDPKTDSGLKKSARGRLVVLYDGETYTLKDNLTIDEQVELEDIDQLEVLWRDGEFVNGVDSFQNIRTRLTWQKRTN